MEWRLYAWCLMGNHYHLCIETPQPNLVEGMRWLQSIRQLPDQSFQSLPQEQRTRLPGTLQSDLRGWMKGTKEAKKAVLEDLKNEQAQRVVEAETSEMREPRWERGWQEALGTLGRDREVLGACRKGEEWKVDVARYLREAYLTPYRWIAEHLCMGAPSYVQSLVSRQRSGEASKEWIMLKKHGKLDPINSCKI